MDDTQKKRAKEEVLASYIRNTKKGIVFTQDMVDSFPKIKEDQHAYRVVKTVCFSVMNEMKGPLPPLFAEDEEASKLTEELYEVTRKLAFLFNENENKVN